MPLDRSSILVAIVFISAVSHGRRTSAPASPAPPASTANSNSHTASLLRRGSSIRDPGVPKRSGTGGGGGPPVGHAVGDTGGALVSVGRVTLQGVAGSVAARV